MKKLLILLIALIAISAFSRTVKKFGKRMTVTTATVNYVVVDPFDTTKKADVKNVSIYNEGPEDLYYWYNVSTNTLNELYTEGFALLVPPGCTDTISEPVNGIRTFVFKTSTNSTRIVIRGE